MRNEITRNTLVTALAVIALAGPTISSANLPAEDQLPSVNVDFSDLNIHSVAGAKVLYKRLKNASEDVCDVRPARELGSLRLTRIAKDCFEATLSKAVNKIDSDTLKSLHKG